MRRGHTLIEMLVVLAILGVAAGAVFPVLVHKTSAVEDTATRIRSILMWSLRQAVERGDTGRVVFDPDTGMYWVGSEREWPIRIWRHDALTLPGNIVIRGPGLLVDIRMPPSGLVPAYELMISDGYDSTRLSAGAGSGITIQRVTGHRTD